ncbi:phosphatase PAP2 family protein [Chloroflexota bacterium]
MVNNLLDLDARITALLRIAEKPGWLRNSAVFFAHSGDSWFWFLALGLIWLAGSAEWKAWALMVGICVLITAVIVMTLKFTIRRRRPEGEWGGIYRKTDPHSFPSGHAARAALLAALACFLGPTWLGWILVIWAPLVILARVAMGVHFVLDVVAGAILGVMIGIILVQFTPLQTFLV